MKPSKPDAKHPAAERRTYEDIAFEQLITTAVALSGCKPMQPSSALLERIHARLAEPVSSGRFTPRLWPLVAAGLAACLAVALFQTRFNPTRDNTSPAMVSSVFSAPDSVTANHTRSQDRQGLATDQTASAEAADASASENSSGLVSTARNVSPSAATSRSLGNQKPGFAQTQGSGFMRGKSPATDTHRPLIQNLVALRAVLAQARAAAPSIAEIGLVTLLPSFASNLSVPLIVFDPIDSPFAGDSDMLDGDPLAVAEDLGSAPLAGILGPDPFTDQSMTRVGAADGWSPDPQADLNPPNKNPSATDPRPQIVINYDPLAGSGKLSIEGIAAAPAGTVYRLYATLDGSDTPVPVGVLPSGLRAEGETFTFALGANGHALSDFYLALEDGP